MERSVADCQRQAGEVVWAPTARRTGNPAPLPSWAWANSEGENSATPRTSRSCSSTVDQGSTNGKNEIGEQRILRTAGAGTPRWIEAKQEGIFHLDVRLAPARRQGLAGQCVRGGLSLLQSDRTGRAIRAASPDQAPAYRRRRRTGPSTGSTPRLLRLRRSSLGHSHGTGAHGDNSSNNWSSRDRST